MVVYWTTLKWLWSIMTAKEDCRFELVLKILLPTLVHDRSYHQSYHSNQIIKREKWSKRWAWNVTSCLTDFTFRWRSFDNSPRWQNYHSYQFLRNQKQLKTIIIIIIITCLTWQYYFHWKGFECQIWSIS